MKSETDWLPAGRCMRQEVYDVRRSLLGGGYRVPRLSLHAGLLAGWLTAGLVLGDIHFEAESVLIEENAGQLTVTVVRDAPTSQSPAAVDYATRDVTALAGEDYLAVSGRLHFAAGETRATVTVLILNDSLKEDLEELLFTLRNASGSFLGQPRELSIWIEDNDPGFRFENYLYVADEDVGLATLTILRGDDGFLPGTVDYRTIAGSALPGEDFQVTSGTVTFGPGDSRQTVGIPILNDGRREAQESFEVSLLDPGAGLGLGEPLTALVRILDNDHGVRFEEEHYWANEDADEVLIPVLRGNDGDFAFTVEVTMNGSAVYGEDHLLEPGTLTFLPGEVSKTLRMPILNDGRHESLEVLQLLLRDPTAGALLDGRYWTTSIWIEDNDPGLQFAVGHCAVPEDTDEIGLVVWRGADVDLGPLTVAYATEEATATGGVDYASLAGRLEFLAGQTQATFSIPILNDALCEGPEWFAVTLSEPSLGHTLGASASMTVTILDNDPGIHFDTGVLSVAEHLGPLSLTVHRGNDMELGPLSVEYFTEDGTAVAGLDFVAGSGRVDFGQDETDQTIWIGMLNDALTETTESFSVVLTNPQGRVNLGRPATVTVRIEDNDPGAHFEYEWHWVAENGGEVGLTVWRGNDVATGRFTVDYHTEAGSATPGEDYETTAGQLEFAQDQMQHRMVVPILNDGLREDDESFSVVLSNPSAGSSLGVASQAWVNISDNDPGVHFAEGWATVPEDAAEVLLRVLRGSDLETSPFTVDYATDPGSASPGEDYVAASGTLEFAEGENERILTIGLLNDALADGNKTFGVTLTKPTGPASLGSPAQAEIYIEDNEIGVHFAPGPFAVPEGAGALEVKVRRGHDGDFPVSVDYTTYEDSASSGTDFTPASGTLSFDPGQAEASLHIEILDDRKWEGDEGFTIALSNVTDSVLLEEYASRFVLILDDDPFQWEARRAPPEVDLGTWHDLAYAKGTYVVTSVLSDGWSASFTLLRSDDLQQWTPVHSAQLGWHNNLDLEASDDRFLISLGSTLLVSTDGTAWTSTAPPSGAWFNDLAAGTDRFVGVGGGRIFTSSDGIDWESQSIPEGIELFRITFTGNLFLAEGDDWINGAPAAFTSNDGEVWHQEPKPELSPFSQRLRCGPLNLRVGDGRLHILQGVDQWVSYSLAENAWISKLTHVQGRLMAAGGQPGLLLVSSPLVYLERAHWLSSGQLSVQVAGPPGTSCDLEASADLRLWEKVDAVTLQEEQQVLLVTSPFASRACFYRLRLP